MKQLEYPEVSNSNRIVIGMAEAALPCDIVSLHLHKHQEQLGS